MRVRFSDLELDEDRRELSRDGEPLLVEPRVFDLIAYLVRHRDRTVSKDELLEQLWPDRDVQDGALSVCVHRARRLVDGGGTPAIQTEARRGYRFIASVRLLREGAGAAQGRDLLVGRSRELAEVHRAVEEVLPGRLRTFEVAGETGVGKTALLEELGSYGLHHRLEVWRAAAPTDAPAEAFTLWVQLIAAYIARYDARPIRRAMGEHLECLARIVPGLRRWVTPGAAETTAEDSDLARLKLMNSIVLAVKAATAHKPGMLLFDDIDHSDADSMAEMRFVLDACADVPVMLGVAFSREADVPGGLLKQMRSLPGHRRLVLRGLDEQAVRAMLEQISGAPVGDAILDAAMRATNGMPLLVEQWARENFSRCSGAL